MPSFPRGLVPWVLFASLGCSETAYDLIANEAVDSIAGGTGGTLLGDGDGDESGVGGDVTLPDEPIDCTSVRSPDLTVVRIQTVSGLCLSRGDAIILGSGMGYEVVLAPCDESPDQRWTIEAESGGVWEIRNEASNMNLDVKFADTADGTEFVLFRPHELYNQRYFPLSSPDGSFALAPRHVMGKCAELVVDSIELWPCEPGNPAQYFEEISCMDP